MFLGFGIMSFGLCRSSLINSDLSLPCYTTFLLFSSPTRLWLCRSATVSLTGPFPGRIIETRICSQCNPACVLSDEYLEEKLIIIVGGADQREKCRGGKCFESKLLSIRLHSSSSSSSSLCAPPHIALLLQSHVRAGRDPF